MIFSDDKCNFFILLPFHHLLHSLYLIHLLLRREHSFYMSIPFQNASQTHATTVTVGLFPKEYSLARQNLSCLQHLTLKNSQLRKGGNGRKASDSQSLHAFFAFSKPLTHPSILTCRYRTVPSPHRKIWVGYLYLANLVLLLWYSFSVNFSSRILLTWPYHLIIFLFTHSKFHYNCSLCHSKSIIYFFIAHSIHECYFIRKTMFL